MVARARRPYVRALKRMAALPSGVLGPVECWAFCRLDFWFFSETIIWNLPSDGENIWDLRDASGNYFVRQICQRALTLGPGETALVRYLWKSPGEPAPYVKLVCVKYYKPWDWVIGIGLPEKEATEARDAIQGVASRSAWILGVLMVLAGGGSAASWLLISRSLMGKIDPVVEELREAAAQVTGAAGQVSQNSEALAQEANESSASTGEVSTSLAQMADVTRGNEEHAARPKELAGKTHASVAEGVKAVEAMSAAMASVKTSSEEVGKIVRTIDEIAFQTNLLALNAAIEAARPERRGWGSRWWPMKSAGSRIAARTRRRRAPRRSTDRGKAAGQALPTAHAWPRGWSKSWNTRRSWTNWFPRSPKPRTSSRPGSSRSPKRCPR